MAILNAVVLGMVYIIEWTFNWDYMMLHHALAYNPLKDLTFPNQDIETFGTVDYSGNAIKTKVTYNDPRRKRVTRNIIVNYKNEPVYEYTFFHFDLQFAMRHLKEGTSEFVVGNACAERYSEMIIKYVGEETVNGIVCRKYEHRTEGILARLLGVRGHIWLAKEDPRHYTVKYTCGLRRNRVWKDFCLQLKEIRQMEPAEWEAFVDELVPSQGFNTSDWNIEPTKRP